jgi:hypothetical protein
VIAKALIPSLLELGLVEANSNKQNIKTSNIKRQYLMWFVKLHVYIHRQHQLESTINYINYKHMTNSHKPNS